MLHLNPYETWRLSYAQPPNIRAVLAESSSLIKQHIVKRMSHTTPAYDNYLKQLNSPSAMYAVLC